MVRIGRRETGDGLEISVQGRLVGPWVEELRSLVSGSGLPSPAIAIDLARVGYVDGPGQELLRDLAAAGVRIGPRSGFVAAVMAAWTSPEAHVTAGAEDQRIVARVLAGDEEGFAALVDRHHPAVLSLARCFAGSGDAEDLARQAWLEVLDTLQEWTPAHSLRAWVLRAVARLGRERPAPGAPAPAARRADEGRGGGDWPEAAVTSAGALSRVRDALGELPFMQRAVVTLRDVIRCDAEVACAVLGLAEPDQRALLHHGRIRLRDALQDHVGAVATA